MSPLNKPFASHVRHSSKVWKTNQIQPSYNFTILSRPKTATTSEKLIQKSPSKSFSRTAPVPLTKGTTSHSNLLSKTIKKTADETKAARKEEFELTHLNNIPWISAEQFVNQVDAASTDDVTLTSVSWAMSAADLSVVDAAREWFRSSSLAQRRTY